MSFCLTELHLWSLKSTLHIADRDIGVYQYYDKKDLPVSAAEHGNLEEKQRLAESRDYPWTLKNRRPEKLRDSLKELEELMQNSQCVLCQWKSKHICQDIHYLALDMGELALAEVARRRADDIDVESVCSGVELLGPLDRRDMLNEGFAGSALTPEGGNPFPDLLPSSGSTPKHTIQQKIPNGPSNRRAIERKNEVMEETEEEEEEEEEAAACTDSSVATTWDAEGELREDHRRQDTEDVGSLRMVHFGLV